MLGYAAFRATLVRVMLVLYAVAVPGSWVWYRPDLLGDVDPLAWRLALSGCALAALVGTFVSEWVRRNSAGVFIALLWLLTAWFLPLVPLNKLHPEYVIGLLLIVTASAFGFAVMGSWKHRSRRVLVYAGFVMTGTIVGAVWASEAHVEPARYIACVGVIITMAIICVRVTTTAEARLVRSEAAARASDERFRRVFENVRDVLFEIDERGRWTLLSPAWSDLTGFSVEESLGRPFFEFVHVEDRPETFVRTQEHFEKGGDVYDEVVRTCTADGEVRWVEIRSRLTYGPGGAPTGAAGTLADITDSVRARAEHEARQQAEELLRLKSSFLHNMSHELRTPLTGILGFAEVLAEEAEGDQAAFAQLIQSSAHRLLGTVNSVLDFAQLEGRGLQLQPKHIDVAEEVAEGVRFLRPLADEKGVSLDVRSEGDVLQAEIDPHALHRIVTNLVGNAIKFTQRGSVTVCVASGNGGVRLSVEDTGIGIPAEMLPHVFAPFRQASEGLDRGHEGNGLGLAITKQLVELLQGEIRVESELGVGTRFEVEFPRRSASAVFGPSGDGVPHAMAAGSNRAVDLRVAPAA